MFFCATYFNNSEWIWPIWPQPDLDVVGAGIGGIGRVSDRDIAAIGDRDGRQQKQCWALTDVSEMTFHHT